MNGIEEIFDAWQKDFMGPAMDRIRAMVEEGNKPSPWQRTPWWIHWGRADSRWRRRNWTKTSILTAGGPPMEWEYAGDDFWVRDLAQS